MTPRLRLPPHADPSPPPDGNREPQGERIDIPQESGL